MKRFINPQKSNYYNDVLTSFSDENRPIFSGLVKSYSTDKYKWLNDFIFKHKGNLTTNSNKAYISFFSDREMVYEEYGNIPDLYTQFPFLTSYKRQLLSPTSYELSSNQYQKIGQKNTDFDLIQFINASKQEFDQNGDLIINHNYMYDPLFHAEGYYLEGYPSNKSHFIWVDNYKNTGYLNLSSFKIALGANKSDAPLGSLQRAEIDNAPSYVKRVFDYKIQVNHKNFFYFQDSSEWVVYYTKVNDFIGNDKIPYFGGVICYDKDNKETKPDNVQYFPDILINGKIEPAKIIISWSTKKSGKCVFNTGNIPGTINDQSRLIFHVCDKMFSVVAGNYVIYRNIDDSVIYNGIDLYTERNKRVYATVMTEPYFTTKAINNGTVVNYKFIDKLGNNIKYVDEDSYISNPGMYLKLKCNLDMINEIDKILTFNNYNTDIINSIIIKNPHSIFTLDSGDYYHKFRETIPSSDKTIFLRRQDDGIFDLLHSTYGEETPSASHANFYIDKWTFQGSDHYSDNKMKIAGLGYYNDTIINGDCVITGENDYAVLYCTNYVSNVAEDPILFLPDNSGANVFRLENNEKFKPLLKLSGINGYIKLLKKNKHFPIVQTNDGQYEVVYTVEFPYCPGSHTERYNMDFSNGYKTTQILYFDSYISAGNKQIYSSSHKVSDNTNDRYILPANSAFTYLTFAYSGPDIETAWFKDGGGSVQNMNVRSSIIYPGNRCLTDLKPAPAMILSEVYKDNTGNAFNYQIHLDSITTEQKDYQLLLFSDNKKWLFNNQYESYIGKENPSYVLEIDGNSLYNDYVLLQKNNAYMPDTKRWLFSYMKGLAHTDVDTTLSNSDIMIDIWDNKSLLGSNNRDGNWRSISPSQYDTAKSKNQLIINSLYWYDNGTETEVDGFTTFKIGYFNPDFLQPTSFPKSFNAQQYDATSNQVLYDSDNLKSYHIAYIRYLNDLGDGHDGFEITVKIDQEITTTTTLGPVTSGPLSLYTTLTFINDFKNFELYSSKILTSQITEENTGLYKKFIDIIKPGSISDKNRYVNTSNKIYFRIGINRKKEYPTTKVSVDIDDFQFIKEVLIYANNPWKYQKEWDDTFDWNKVNFMEDIKKLGLSYFKLSSI